jgi:hypothetical protein
MLVKSNYLPVDFAHISILQENDIIIMTERHTIEQMTQNILIKA